MPDEIPQEINELMYHIAVGTVADLKLGRNQLGDWVLLLDDEMVAVVDTFQGLMLVLVGMYRGMVATYNGEAQVLSHEMVSGRSGGIHRPRLDSVINSPAFLEIV